MYDRSSIVFSSATLQKFVLEAMTNESICSSKNLHNAATEELGRCLSNIQVQAGDSRDHEGYHRFLPFQLKNHLSSPLNKSLETHKKFLDYSYYHVSDVSFIVTIIKINFY